MPPNWSSKDPMKGSWWLINCCNISWKKPGVQGLRFPWHILKNHDQTLLSHSVDGNQKFPARKPVEVKVVEIPLFPGWLGMGFLNHQQSQIHFQITPHCNPLVIKRLSLHKLCWRAWCSCWNDNTTGAFGTCKRDAASPRIVGLFLDKNPWN